MVAVGALVLVGDATVLVAVGSDVLVGATVLVATGVKVSVAVVAGD